VAIKHKQVAQSIKDLNKEMSEFKFTPDIGVKTPCLHRRMEFFRATSVQNLGSVNKISQEKRDNHLNSIF
jgi:hypothetical protein